MICRQMKRIKRREPRYARPQEEYSRVTSFGCYQERLDEFVEVGKRRALDGLGFEDSRAYT